MKARIPLHLKDLAVPGFLVLMWAFFLLWYSATF